MPESWEAQQTSDDEIWYVNKVTGQTTLEHPLDDKYKKLYMEKKRQKVQRTGVSMKPELRNFQESIGEAKEDPLLKKEFEKKIKAHKEKLEKEYKEKCADIDANIEREKPPKAKTDTIADHMNVTVFSPGASP